MVPDSWFVTDGCKHSMSDDVKQAKQRVSIAWNIVRSSISTIAYGSDIRPGTSNEIFKFTRNVTNNDIQIEVEPIVFMILERAPSPSKKLYICVEGRLDFYSPFLQNSRPSAKAFSTSVGYFRHHSDRLDHVYGVHYDFDEFSVGHPVFHAQMKPMMKFSENIHKQFHDNRNICDMVTPVLRNVRTPSAEMDIFSVFAQIIADHLIYDDIGDEVMKKFIDTLNACDFFAGVAQKLTNFNQVPPASNYRSPCWYPEFLPK